MKPAPFTLVAPGSLDDALAQLEGGNARVLAGGLSLIPMLKLRLATPETVVDISRLHDLDYIRIEADAVRIGAMRRVSDLLDDASFRAALPIAGDILANIGTVQIRNASTLVGALCHADPASEALLLAILLGGEVEIRGRSGSRIVSISDFVAAPLTTNLAPAEIVIEVRLRLAAVHSGHGFRAYAPRPGDYSLCAAGVILAGNDKAPSAHVAVAGIDHLPRQLGAVEELLQSNHFSRSCESEIGRIVREASVLSDRSGGAEFRAELASRLVISAFRDALARRDGGAT